MNNTANNAHQLVLVTGGSGFIATHCMLQLLNAGYRVRATLRSRSREAEVRAMLREGGVDAGERLSFAVADLGADAGWREAAEGCAYVLHGASPTPSQDLGHEDAWIAPARDGVLRVLRTARDAGVRRVVLTSAFGAVGYGHGPRATPFDETDWTNLTAKVPPYQKSKTLSEQAAWRFIAEEGDALELSVVNPVAVFGPVLGPDYSHSIRLIKQLLDGQPGCPKLHTCVVDVRDVADLHLRAMTDPAAKGERFLASAGACLSILDVATILKKRLGARAEKVPTRELPNWLVRLAALRNPALRAMLPHLGMVFDASGDKARRVLGWRPRPNEEAIVAAAQSLDRLGLLNG